MDKAAADEDGMVHMVGRVAGWALLLAVAVAIVTFVLSHTPIGGPGIRFIHNVSLVTAFVAFFVWGFAESQIEDRARPEVVAAIARSLGLTVVADLPPGLRHLLAPADRWRYVMTGEHDGRGLVACLAVRNDSEGDVYWWCVMLELPVPLTHLGITAGKSKIRPCRDWPPRVGVLPYRRPKRLDPVFAALTADPAMRMWLEGLSPQYHFHFRDRWVASRGPTTSLPGSLGGSGLGPVLETAKGIVDHIPNHILWGQAPDSWGSGSVPSGSGS